ncbi:hypothetical protein VTO73DRAFT_13572 [Trametes versicolor]
MPHSAQDDPAASGAPEAGANLIPQPKKVSEHLSPNRKGNPSLATQMRLGKTARRLAFYCRLVARIAALSEKHAAGITFITTSTKHPQYAEWQAFVDIVKDELPIINAYENAWPVAAIVRVHRHKKKVGGVGLLNWEDKAPRGSDSTHQATLDSDAEHPELHHAADSATGRSASASAAANAPSLVASRRPAQDPDAGRSRDRTNRPYNGPRDSTPRTRGSQFLQSVYIRARPAPSTGTSFSAGLSPGTEISSSAGPSSGAGFSLSTGPSSASAAGVHSSGYEDASGLVLAPVREFLRALHPEQTALLPVLVKKGVRTGADLDGLACMPRERRKRLLILWLLEEAITQLQFEALDAGFEAMIS